MRRKGEMCMRRAGARKMRKMMMSDVEIADRIIIAAGVVLLFQMCHRLQVCSGKNAGLCKKQECKSKRHYQSSDSHDVICLPSSTLDVSAFQNSSSDSVLRGLQSEDNSLER